MDDNVNSNPSQGPDTAGAAQTLPTTTPTDKPPPGGAHYASAAIRRHGSGVRGLELSRQSLQFEGRFGRLFRTLPGAVHTDADLKALAMAMTAKADVNTPETQSDDEENTAISAGYTYLGQFIDHDLTFDPNSSLQRQNDPDGLTDFRTPRFDLDNVYGRGPDDQPYLYQDDGIRMLLGRPLTGVVADPGTRGVPRNAPGDGPTQANPAPPRRALIGDPRNDENVIVSNLQATILRFHNKMADLLAKKHGHSLRFEQVQREVRFHYQWVLLHDFLPTVIGRDRVLQLVPQIADDGMRQGPTDFPRNPNRQPITTLTSHLRFYKVHKNAYMPIEFSVAAYRFGHSMVRPIYRLNATLTKSDFTFSDDGRQMIFAALDPARNAESLVGFRDFPAPWAVNWSLFFRMGPNTPFGPQRLQPAYKIDTSLVNPLGNLPSSVASDIPSLAERNLLRGRSMSLPSGQAVTRAMGLEPIPDEKLLVGKATEESTKGSATVPKNAPLTNLSSRFADNAPLWYYILAEAQQAFVNNGTEIRLGAVGGTIVGEVFVGLLFADSHSYVQQHPNWQPHPDFVGSNGVFGIAELLRAVRS
jgi:hypothetical protein